MFALMAPVLATEPVSTDNVNLAAPTGFTELGKITFNNLVTGGVKLVLVAAALIFFFILIVGGIRWILSGGDENQVKEARAQITNALIGLGLVFLIFMVLRLIGLFFGIDSLENNLKLTMPTLF